MDKKQYYKSKAKDSFKTKFNLYLFSKVIHQKTDRITIEDFQSFEINDEIVNLYTTEYWQQEIEKKIVDKLTIDEIYNEINDWTKNNTDLIGKYRKQYIDSFNNIFPQDEFNRLVDEKTCDYCGITRNEIEKLGVRSKLRKKNLRGWNLEIDRKAPNYEYTKDNCVMSCYWCNNAKTDEFLYDEFREIGIAIGKVWVERLKDDN